MVFAGSKEGINMFFYIETEKIKNELSENRRFFHKTAEVGLEMPLAQEYVMKKLTDYGLSPKKCGHGVTALIGSGSPVLLLRADMDALPMEEMSGEDFACTSGHAHACGHDLHAAMLLGAAKVLKNNEEMLKGTVKLMFQPAEETFEGSRDMIANGILEEPHVDAALAFHVAPGKLLPGAFMYNAGGVMMNSVDGFHIDIKGKGGHGAYPNLAVDPLNIASHIYTALEALIAREADPEKVCVLTIGQLHGGQAANIIPDSAFMEGTLRTNDRLQKEKLSARIAEIAEKTAELYGGTAQVTKLSDVPPLICDKELTEKMVGYMNELGGLKPIPDMKANASEDFAVIASAVPSAFMYLSAGFDDERGEPSAHNPKVCFNEAVLPIGAAALAHCAARWLEEK